jgi:hypothetical protein
MPFPAYNVHIDPSFVPDAPSEPNGKHPLRHFASAFFRRTRDVMRGFGKDALELHDITAVWAAAVIPPAADDQTPLALPAGWETYQRMFAVERTGEYTRGMCVVDRRDEAMAYASGANRAKLQEELIKADAMYRHVESAASPAPVMVDSAESTGLPGGYNGVNVVCATPGPDALLKLLFARVWGVQI